MQGGWREREMQAEVEEPSRMKIFLTLWEFRTLCTNFKGTWYPSPSSLYSFVLRRRGGQGTTTLFIEKSFWVLFIQSWFNLEIQIYRDCVALWLSRASPSRVAREFHLRFFFVFFFLLSMLPFRWMVREVICWRCIRNFCAEFRWIDNFSIWKVGIKSFVFVYINLDLIIL